MKRRLALGALLACACLGAQAHRFHAGITDIAFNPNTGSIEVVHTYMAHDIEALLANLYQRQFDLSDPQDEAVLRKYIDRQFYLLGADNARLPLRWVGVTTNVDNVVIYQEVEKTPLAAAVRLRDDVLIDFLPDQVNTVNVNRAGAVATLSFDRNKKEQQLP
ncbi:hypothetical protein HF313_28115 [Massilia atriviolacea]|uniref:Uncharacterized protein n=1 Tax=Massilia atriviolacea TaxID=2495579 RepID=A0A430HEV9_9BURK|nr:DUF6702 family protein [Massilia atriviolacea]RSZ56032.1 hypothetical protein EJB06_26900 [Massilia atriviolacea]